MCLMLSVINCSRKCPTVKKTEKKKAVRNVYLFSFFMTLPSLHFPFSEGRKYLLHTFSGVCLLFKYRQVSIAQNYAVIVFLKYNVCWLH